MLFLLSFGIVAASPHALFIALPLLPEGGSELLIGDDPDNPLPAVPVVFLEQCQAS